MNRQHDLIIKETHRGLLYEDGVLREVLAAGHHRIPRAPSPLAEFFGARAPRVEVALVDVRCRDLTVAVLDLLTADCATISASFVVQYRVDDPRAAVHDVRNFEERLQVEAQTAARRTLRGLSLGEVIEGRDEIGEELHRLVGESAAAYGLHVSAVDFKDLVLPDEIRDALNRAACASRLRRVEAIEVDDEGFAGELPDLEPTEPEVRLARMEFDRQAELTDGGTPPRSQGHDKRPGGPPAADSEGLRRFRS